MRTQTLRVRTYNTLSTRPVQLGTSELRSTNAFTYCAWTTGRFNKVVWDAHCQYPWHKKIVDNLVPWRNSTCKNKTDHWCQLSSCSFAVKLHLHSLPWRINAVKNSELTWPKKRNGKRNVRPRHIHDWKPSENKYRNCCRTDTVLIIIKYRLSSYFDILRKQDEKLSILHLKKMQWLSSRDAKSKLAGSV